MKSKAQLRAELGLAVFTVGAAIGINALVNKKSLFDSFIELLGSSVESKKSKYKDVSDVEFEEIKNYHDTTNI